MGSILNRLESEQTTKLLREYSISAIMGSLVVAIYNIVDSIYIGHGPNLGDHAIGGLGIVFPIMTFFTALGAFVGTGAATRFAIYMGEGCKDKMDRALGNALVLIILLTGFFVLLTYIFIDPLLHIIGATQDTYHFAREFLIYYLPCCSAFGFGGTNFHVVMENHKKEEEHNSCLPLWPSELFVFRGDSLIEAKQQLQKIKELLSYNDTINIKNIAYSLAVHSKKEVQVSIIASDCKELQNRIDAALAAKEEYGIYFKNAKEGKIAFMFSGQGSQRVNMARDMFVVFPAMRRLLTKHKEYEKILFPYSAFDEETRKEQEEVITDTRNAQPLLGIVDFAFAEFLKSLGIIPDMVAGHSYGELAALCFAGAFDAEELVPLSHKRALSILDAIEEDKGKMIAVSLPETEIITLLDGEKDVWAVNFNSPKQIVLAGSTEGINSFMRKLSNKNIAYKELNVACAFHSPLLHKSRELYADVLQKVDFKTLNIPVWSNTTAEYYPTGKQEIKNRLSEHLIKPVLFTRQVENMYNEGARIFIEVGPGRVLTGLVQSILGDKVSAFETENKSFNGVTFILHTIAKYLSTGRSVDVEKLFEKRNTSIVNIDKPEQYKKSPIVWHINGHNAIPTDGRMPSTGAYPITQPIMNLENMTNNLNNNSTSGLSSSDQVILEYLNSMRMMLQSQRDVMLGYLGHTPNNISTPIQTNSVQQVHGKPYVYGLEETKGLEISLAHKNGASVSIVSEKSVGIDIETMEERTKDFLEISFTLYELELIKDKDITEWSTRFWVAKEAYGKMLGVGLQGNPKRYEVKRINEDILFIEDCEIKIFKYKNYIIGWTQ